MLFVASQIRRYSCSLLALFINVDDLVLPLSTKSSRRLIHEHFICIGSVNALMLRAIGDELTSKLRGLIADGQDGPSANVYLSHLKRSFWHYANSNLMVAQLNCGDGRCIQCVGQSVVVL